MSGHPGVAGHDEAYAALGAYVLGALGDEERERVAAHVAGCAACRQDIADLQIAADVLPQGVEPLEPPPELRQRIMAVVRSEAELLDAAGAAADRPPTATSRRRWWRASWSIRPGVAALGAAAILAAGVVTGALVSGADDGPAPSTVQARLTPAAGAGASATLAVQPDGGGRLAVRGMANPAPGRVYQVWVQPAAGAPIPTDALFTVSRAGTASVDVPGGLAEARAVLVTSEPRGGSRVPSGAPVIVAPLT